MTDEPMRARGRLEPDGETIEIEVPPELARRMREGEWSVSLRPKPEPFPACCHPRGD